MRKIVFTLLAAAMLVACNKPAQTDKDMHQLSFTSEQAAWMTAIAANEAKGDLIALESAIQNGLEADLFLDNMDW